MLRSFLHCITTFLLQRLVNARQLDVHLHFALGKSAQRGGCQGRDHDDLGEDGANDEFVKLSTLIIAMQSYGSSAQQYFNRLEKPH